MGLFSGILGGVKKLVGGITGGDLLTGGLGFLGGERANEATSASTAAQMAFQERMRSTQYQTTMADMKKAGLNPILAYQQGGAGTPGGAAAQFRDSITPAVSTAMQAKRLSADLQNLHEQNANIASSTALNDALRVKAQADAHLSNSSARQVLTNTQLLESNLPKAKIDEEINSGQWGKILRWVERIGESIGSPIRGASPLFKGIK